MKKVLILRFKRGFDKSKTEEMMKNVSKNLHEMNIAHIVMTDDIEYEIATISESQIVKD